MDFSGSIPLIVFRYFSMRGLPLLWSHLRTRVEGGNVATTRQWGGRDIGAGFLGWLDRNSDSARHRTAGLRVAWDRLRRSERGGGYLFPIDRQPRRWSDCQFQPHRPGSTHRTEPSLANLVVTAAAVLSGQPHAGLLVVVAVALCVLLAGLLQMLLAGLGLRLHRQFRALSGVGGLPQRHRRAHRAVATAPAVYGG